MDTGESPTWKRRAVLADTEEIVLELYNSSVDHF